MKLSNQQVEALVGKYAAIVDAKLLAEYKRKREIEEKVLLPKAKKYFTMYSRLPKELVDMMISYESNRLTEAKILDRLVKIDFVKPDKALIRQRILLASIDSATMQDLEMRMK